MTYDPRRLSGVTLVSRRRSCVRGWRSGAGHGTGSGVVTSPIESSARSNEIDEQGPLQIRLDSGRTVRFRLNEHPHLDYGYAVTSYSSQGQTADRVLIHIDADRVRELLVNRRLAYVAVSRARYDVQIYTNDRAQLIADLAARDFAPFGRRGQPRKHSQRQHSIGLGH